MTAAPRASRPDDPTVPEALYGCWQRAFIELADGARDDTTVVIWLQLPSEMADMRVPSSRGALRDRAGLGGCSLDDMRVLAASEASTGYTTCTPIEVGSDGVRRATAEWITRGDGDVALHPVTAYPEPGLLEWTSDDVLIERAPSGAYVEEWHRVPGSTSVLEHRVIGEGRHLYVAGEVAVVVRDRPTALPAIARLDSLLADCGDDRARAAALVDCEFSFARRASGGEYVIEASTLPWREGEAIDVDLR